MTDQSKPAREITPSSESPDVERVENERIALEREILDPNTSEERLKEIQQQLGAPKSVSKPDNRGWLNDSSDEELIELLKDKSTPLEFLEDILRIAKSRERSKPLPRKDK